MADVMIIGLAGSAVLGSIERIDLLDGTKWLEDVPVMILREATAEEWLREYVDRGRSIEEARERLRIRTRQFPSVRFYEVSVD